MICVVAANRSADGEWFGGDRPDAFWLHRKIRNIIHSSNESHSINSQTNLVSI